MARFYGTAGGNKKYTGFSKFEKPVQYSPWEDGLEYESNDFIIEGGILYRCKAAHTAIPDNHPQGPNGSVNWALVGVPEATGADAGKFLKADGTWSATDNATLTDNGDGSFTFRNLDDPDVVIPAPAASNTSSITDNGDGSYTHDDGSGTTVDILPAVESVTVTFTTGQWVADSGDFVLDIPDSVHGLANGVGAVTLWEANEVIGAQVQIIGTTLQLRVASAFTGEVTIVSRSPNIVALP